MQEKTYYVYIVTSKRNGTLYIGVTNDLIKRIWQHKNKSVEGFTKKYNVSNLVYYETTNDVQVALQREKQLKKWNRKWKLELIEKFNPEWKDLAEEYYRNN
ncbi:MAG TPA: excinuclease ABC subunit C [Candidatus Moranbacteria bacterium]|nr:MAG: hypothetical protein UW95_C0025G0010 [Parcubacteria group bacterium GW2011_GWC1_45_14]HAV11423.1 excinuclease ABC subunit C [Candidatus Moranbacteria bacterium]